MKNRIRKELTCLVYCKCRLPDDGTKMIQCDNCLEWYHVECMLDLNPQLDDQWFCDSCDSQQSSSVIA